MAAKRSSVSEQSKIMFLIIDTSHVVRDLPAVDQTQIYGGDQYDGKHVPVRSRNQRPEPCQHRVFRLKGVHVIHLHHRSGWICDMMCRQISVQRQIGKMDQRVDDEGDRQGCRNASEIFLHKAEPEHENGDAEFQQVRKEVKTECGREEDEIGLRRVYDQCDQRAQRPEQQQIVQHLVPGEHGKGEDQRVERTQVQRQILKGRAPHGQIKEDGGDAGK